MVFHRDGNRIRQLRQPAAAHFIVGVDDGLTVMVSREQQPFRGFVVLHIAMIIKMVAAQVGKHGCSKFQRRDAVLYQTVRRDLHRGEGCALPCQTSKHVLYVNRRAGGVFRRAHFAQQTVTHGPHHRTGFTQQLGPLRHQLRGGGFTVRTRYANQTQLVGRFVIKTSRQCGKTFV